ncbi:hypothetical protein ACFYOK_35585 [Microbispora bryophytorum]|uniref:hypothetical protein n=1 Tax=Microbispora bryophytorum TaxID=1460882 RepID=UPI003406E6FF
MSDKAGGPQLEIVAAANRLPQHDDLLRALSSASSLQQQLADLAQSLWPKGLTSQLQEQMQALARSPAFAGQGPRVAGLLPEMLAESTAQKLARDLAATFSASSGLSASMHGLAATIAASSLALDLAGLHRALGTLGRAGSMLSTLTRDYNTAFSALSDFARTLQAVPPSPPGPPAPPTAMPDERNVVASDSATLIESAHVEEVVSLAGLTPEQMRLVLVWYVNTLVLLTVAGAVIQYQEAAGVVSSIVGGSAHSVARWCSGLIGKSFDKLYPPEAAASATSRMK